MIKMFNPFETLNNSISLLNDFEFSKKLYIEEVEYKIKVKKESSNILITCNLKEDIASKYDYSINLSYDEFLVLGRVFKQCKDIDDIYELLKNVMNNTKIHISFSKEINSMTKLELTNNELKLNLTIPLLTGKTEDIIIQFVKKERDINEQFEKLKEKYFSLIKLIKDNKYSSQTQYKTLEELIEKEN